MNAIETGRKAVTAARVYLEMRGYTIIEQNWRRSRCKIDLIAVQGEVMHFVEVVYRQNGGQDGGLDTITATKLKQMRSAAFSWVDETKWHGKYVFSAIEMSGPNFTVMNFLRNVF